MDKRIFYGFVLIVLAFVPRIAAMECNKAQSEEENNRNLREAVLRCRYTQSYCRVSRTNAQIIQKLLQAGANPNQIIEADDQISVQGSGYADRSGLTLLEFAIVEGVHLLVLILLEGESGNKANVNAYNKVGDTPLHVAITKGWASLVKDLLQHGADPRLENAAGLPALEYARSIKAPSEIVDDLSRPTSIKPCTFCQKQAALSQEIGGRLPEQSSREAYTNCAKQVVPFVVLICLALIASMLCVPSEL